MSAAAFRARYAAYTLDLVLLSPVAAVVVSNPAGRLVRIVERLEIDLQFALDRAFGDGHTNLMALATALRTDGVFIAAFEASVRDALAASLQALALAILVLAAWFIAFEASPWQATPGKRVLGLRVERLDGAPMGLKRSALRFVAAAPSWLMLHLGHAMAAWRKDGRALHDRIAGTRVVGEVALPLWARLFLAAQIGVVLALFGWWVGTMVAGVFTLGL